MGKLEGEPRSTIQLVPAKFHLARLRHFVSLSTGLDDLMSEKDPQWGLLCSATFSVYVDCIESGVGALATMILRGDEKEGLDLE